MKKKSNDKKTHPLFLSLLPFFLAAVSFVLYGCSGEQQSSDALSPLTVTILKAGKADAIVLTDGSHTVLIDCGEEDDGQKMVKFLSDQGISSVDCLIITHFDQDHIGGADHIAENFPISRILLPAYEGTHSEYEDFLSVMERRGLKAERLTAPESFTLGDASFYIEPPLSYEITDGDEEYDNNFSLITTVTHGSIKMLFTGDIEKKRTREWLDSGSVPACDFIKMPHHGAYNKELKSLLAAVQPRYAAITCSDKNPADEKTLALLESLKVETLLTRDGNISVISDGLSLKMRQ